MLVVSLRRKAGDGLGELEVLNQTSLTLQLSRRIWRMELGRCAPMVLEEKPLSSSGKSDSDIPASHMGVTVTLTQPQNGTHLTISMPSYTCIRL